MDERLEEEGAALQIARLDLQQRHLAPQRRRDGVEHQRLPVVLERAVVPAQVRHHVARVGVEPMDERWGGGMGSSEHQVVASDVDSIHNRRPTI